MIQHQKFCHENTIKRATDTQGEDFGDHKLWRTKRNSALEIHFSAIFRAMSININTSTSTGQQKNRFLFKVVRASTLHVVKITTGTCSGDRRQTFVDVFWGRSWCPRANIDFQFAHRILMILTTSAFGLQICLTIETNCIVIKIQSAANRCFNHKIDLGQDWISSKLSFDL